MPEREHVRPPPRRSASRSCNTRTGNCGVQTTFCVRHVRFHPGGARPQTEVLNACIDQHRNTYVGGLICKVLQIAPSTYRRHAARHRNPELRSAHAKHDEVLMLHIERVWQANMQVYGAEKVWKQMNHEDIVVAHCAVGRLKRRLGLEGVRVAKPSAVPCQTQRRLARWIESIDSSRRIAPTSSGFRISRTCRLVRVGSTWRSSSARSPDALWTGTSAPP